VHGIATLLILACFRGPVGIVRNDALVDVRQWIPEIAQDIRYATTNNFTRVAVYPTARCLLRFAVVKRLVRVQRALEKRGLGLKVWDCYRPFSVQEKFFAIVSDEKYVARPVRKNGQPVSGSKHNRGAAVDITLIDAKTGQERTMPTGYDDFSEKAHRDYAGATPEQKRNRELLQQAMVKEGFEPLPTEWWHFDGPGWQKYPLSDEPLARPEDARRN
jgi:beta-N-acetylhexosaminidase/D-alanyl-D-alanine dipeptidase